jgi:hypothetical protein
MMGHRTQGKRGILNLQANLILFMIILELENFQFGPKRGKHSRKSGGKLQKR